MPLAASARLFHSHVPFNKTANLSRGISARHHPVYELRVLFLRFAVLFGTKRDHRQQVLDLAEHALLDDIADLLVRCPAWILPSVFGTRPERELDDLVAEILRVRDAGWLLNPAQLLIKHLPVHKLAGVWVLEVLVFDPGISVRHVAVEEILTKVAVALKIRFLNLVADELGIPRPEI